MSANAFPKYRRRSFFIKKRLQGRFIAGFSIAVFLGYFLNLLLVYFLIDRELTSELYRIHLRIRTTSEIAVPILWKLSLIIIPLIIVISAVLGYVLTRRVELPLLKFKQALKKTAEGDFTSRLMEDKVAVGLSEAFNAMTASLSVPFSSLKESAERLDEAYGRLEKKPGGLKRALGGITEARIKTERALDKLKV
ncbi:MAG: methyl-accepting chemotaxis protein [Deltaproteobacteria bacterium]|nr:methyl-accepting chemotaxis protein [Deltaproteobacteria bacterium]